MNDDIEAMRVALVGLRRLFQRKELTALWAAAAGSAAAAALDYGELRLLDAVASAARDRPTTVGDVALRLGVDPSRASRQVARAVRRGVLERRIEPGDARKVGLAVTRKGAALQRRGGDLTRARIAVATRDWPAADRRRFAALFRRFADAMLGNM